MLPKPPFILIAHRHFQLWNHSPFPITNLVSPSFSSPCSQSPAPSCCSLGWSYCPGTGSTTPAPAPPLGWLQLQAALPLGLMCTFLAAIKTPLCETTGSTLTLPLCGPTSVKDFLRSRHTPLSSPSCCHCHHHLTSSTSFSQTHTHMHTNTYTLTHTTCYVTTEICLPLYFCILVYSPLYHLPLLTALASSGQKLPTQSLLYSEPWTRGMWWTE